MARYRPLEWPRDREALSRLDTSFTTGSVYDLRPGPFHFELAERRIDPALHKQFDINVDALPASTRVVVAERNGQAIGVIALDYQAWNRRAVISHFYVDRPARGSGVGTALVREARGHAVAMGARCLWLETQNVNVPAIRFYLRHGFACCGLDATLYDPRDVPGDEVALFFALALE